MFVLPTSIHHQNALSIRQEGLVALEKSPDDLLVSGEKLTAFDSTALSVLMALVRAYPSLKIVEAPKKLVSLSKVYGLDEVLPLVTRVE